MSRMRQKEARDYSLQELHKQKRREFALSDPEALKKDRPAREGDDDPRCGPASLQKFDGERLEYDKTVNRKFYQDLQKQWLMEQIEERKAIEQAEKDHEKRHDDQMIMASHVRGVMERHLDDTKRAQKTAESDINVALACEHRERRRNKLRSETEAEAQHVSNVMNHPMLNELVGPQVGSDGRMIRGSFKGMSQEQKHDAYHYNALQIQHKRNARRAEEAEEKAHAESIGKGVAVMGAVEQHRAQIEREQRRMMDHENSVIAQAQRNMQQHLKSTYSNAVANDYFDKFNSTAR